MTAAEQIAAEARKLPDALAQEALDFIFFPKSRHLRHPRAQNEPMPD